VSSTVAWKNHGPSPLASSTVVFTSGSGGTNTAGKATIALSGSVTAGSFSGNAAANLTVAQSLTSIGKQCAHGHLRGLTSAAASSTLSLG
jgi:hypothetical protein